MPSATDRKAESEHEMTEMPRDDMATALLGGKENNTSHSSVTPKYPQLRDFLRHSRLQILGTFLGKLFSRHGEPRKVALYRRRRVAAFHCLLHLVPLGGALTLLALHWNHYWIGDTPPDSTILQFVAKFHELLMQVSIVEAILCIIRSEAVHGFVPLGVLSAAMQPTQLAYLWSLDFFSILSSEAFQGRWLRKILVFITIPASIVSTALVGPSSAVLMIPERGYSGSSTYDKMYYGPIESMFPTSGLEMDFTAMNYTILSTALDDRKVEHYQDRDRAEAEIRFQNPPRNERFMNALWYETTVKGHNHTQSAYGTKATISANYTNYALQYADLAGLFSEQRTPDSLNGTISVTLPQPVTEAVCILGDGLTWGGRVLPSTELYYVQSDGASLRALGNASSLASRVQGQGTIAESFWSEEWQIRIFDAVWLTSPESTLPSLLGVFFQVNELSNTTELLPLDLLLADSESLSIGVTVKICSITAYWNTVESSMTQNQGSVLPTRSQRLSKLKDRDRRNITLDASNITLDTSSVDFYRDSSDMGMHNLYDKQAYLATAFALALADIPTEQYAKVVLETILPQFLDQYANATVRWTPYGYGFFTDSTSIRLALTVILAYCIISVTYLIYILISGETSTAWNSAIELVVLALQSKKPEYPDQGHTGVGIDSLNTFRQGVGIRVNNDNELELVFANDRDIEKRGLRKIERNTAY